MDHEALNDMKASELKISKRNGSTCLRSKSEFFINRIIEASEPARIEELVPSMDQAIDALLDRHDKSTKEKKTEKPHVIMEAEIVEDNEIKSDESEFEILLLDDDTEEENPSVN